MSQIILDEQLYRDIVLLPIKRWISAKQLHTLRRGEIVKDDRVPTLLQRFHQPTFITIDGVFWKRRLCHSKYGIVYFAFTNEQQAAIPSFLRRLLRLPEFHTRAARMGKVARESEVNVQWWQLGNERLRRSAWLD